MGRIWALFLRYMYQFLKPDQFSEFFYWPAIDIFLWGMTSVWIQHQDPGSHLAAAILTGLIFWQILWRASFEITMSLLQEFWNRNLVNLFSTPLKLHEWIFSLLFLGSVKIVISLLFGSLFVYILYSLNVFSLGWIFLPYAALLMLSGWFIGFLAAGIMICYGQRTQSLAWMTAYLFAPFSAVFYPVEVLPTWAQKIAYCLPTTYVFEGMRQLLLTQLFSWQPILMSLGLNVLYLGASITFFVVMFEKSRNKGLSRLE